MIESSFFGSLRALYLPLVLAVVACKTEIAFENDLPGAKLENVKWKAPRQTYYLREYSDGELSPGETSEFLGIHEERDIGGSGVIEFDLLHNGRRTHLVTREKFTAVANEQSVFTIHPDTAVENGLDDDN